VKFLYPIYIYLQGVTTHWNFTKMFDTHKTRMIVLPCGEEIVTIH